LILDFARPPPRLPSAGQGLSTRDGGQGFRISECGTKEKMKWANQATNND